MTDPFARRVRRHRTTVLPTTARAMPAGEIWRATCSCGWRGEQRESFERAHNDAQSHVDSAYGRKGKS